MSETNSTSVDSGTNEHSEALSILCENESVIESNSNNIHATERCTHNVKNEGNDVSLDETSTVMKSEIISSIGCNGTDVVECGTTSIVLEAVLAKDNQKDSVLTTSTDNTPSLIETVNEQSTESDEVVVVRSEASNFEGGDESKQYRQPNNKDSSDDDSDSLDEVSIKPRIVESDYDSDDDDGFGKRGKKGAEAEAAKLMRTRGELGLENLPPIEDLKITVPEDLILEEIGQISSVVDVLVVVQARRNLPPLDADSVLFLKDRVILGQIFETFGPVVAPLYSIRFNKVEDIADKNITVGAKVFYGTNYRDFTQYVFVESIRNQKGSDASWENNNEPPPHCLDYSDDEEERKIKRQLKAKRVGDGGSDGDEAKSEQSEERPTVKARRRGRGGTHVSDHQQHNNRGPRPDHAGSWNQNSYQPRPPRGPFGAYQYSGRPSHSGGGFPYDNANNHPVYGKYFSPVHAPVPPPYGYGFGQPPAFSVPPPFGRMPPGPYDFNAPHMHPSHFNPGPSPFQPHTRAPPPPPSSAQ